MLALIFRTSIGIVGFGSGNMNNIFLIIAGSLFIIPFVCCQYENETIYSLLLNSQDDIQNTAKCVLDLSAKYFVDKRALSGSIVIININSYTSKTQKTLLETIHNGKKYSVMVKDSFYKHKNASHFPEKAKNYMMILEDKKELLRNILQLNKLPTWNPHAKSVIYIELKPENDLEDLVKSIINELRNYKLLNTIVLVNFPDTKEVIAYTWKPYSKTNCAGPCDSIFILDVCHNNKLIEQRVAESILPQNMNLCPLVVYTVISEPYILPPTRKIQDSKYDDQYEFLLGTEINIMKVISRRTNMTFVVRMSNISEDWGYIRENGSATGLFGKLRTEDADIIVGNLAVNKVIRKWFDPSSTYMQDEITWCVPKARKAATWFNLVTIFKMSTWVVTFASILVMSVLLHWFMYRERKHMTKWPTISILMTLGMILGWGGLFQPKGTAFRILLFSWLLFSININTSYQSFLRSFLIHPKYEKQIDSDTEIIQAEYGVGGKATLKDYFSGAEAIDEYVQEKFETCTSFKKCVERVSFDKNFALAASKRQVIYQDLRMNKGNLGTYCFPENILYKYGVVILARKWFPMLNRFNGIIRSVTENGLIWKWNNEVFLHSTAVADGKDMVPLGMEHMLGAFLFLSMGYIMCFCVLLMEVTIFKANETYKKKFDKLRLTK